MRAAMQRNVFAILAILLVCVTVVTVIECQSYATPSGHEQSAPARHHHASSVLGFDCLIAVLPAGLLLMVFLFSAMHTALLLLPYTSPTFRLFIPPK